MITTATCLSPGVYQYFYATFADRPQYICINFVTHDGQQAFVSYPHHPRRRAAQLIPIQWFESVRLVQTDAQPQLMGFIRALSSSLFQKEPNSLATRLLSDEADAYSFNEQLAA